MKPILAKLNVGRADPVVILNAPASFDDAVAELSRERRVVTSRADIAVTEFLLGFATTSSDLAELSSAAGELTSGDAIVWIAYPKASSKNYTCEFNRDTGWDGMGAAGFEPVRQVAIDADWTALRFRRAEFITSWTRTFAYSELGKRRIAERESGRSVD